MCVGGGGGCRQTKTNLRIGGRLGVEVDSGHVVMTTVSLVGRNDTHAVHEFLPGAIAHGVQRAAVAGPRAARDIACTDRQTDRQVDRQVDRQTDRRTDRGLL